jgi:hypothetical protein
VPYTLRFLPHSPPFAEAPATAPDTYPQAHASRLPPPLQDHNTIPEPVSTHLRTWFLPDASYSDPSAHIHLAHSMPHDLPNPRCVPRCIYACIFTLTFAANTLSGLILQATGHSCASSISFVREEHFRPSRSQLSFPSDFLQVLLLHFEWTGTLMAIDDTESQPRTLSNEPPCLPDADVDPFFGHGSTGTGASSTSSHLSTRHPSTSLLNPRIGPNHRWAYTYAMATHISE